MLINRLFSILSCDTPAADVVTFKVKLNPDFAIYEGHFPSNPITPGVCLVQLCCELSETFYQRPLRITKAKNIKFTKLLKPHEYPIVDCQLSFEASNGLLLVKSTIFCEDVQFCKMNLELNDIGNEK